ncbi:MAG: hypothetical protein MJ110_00990 [Lachnospiraceae bacterium]|nr:hypothetical protein [Lachnospiraceae bacterium]
MVIAKSMEVRDNFKALCGKVSSGEIVQINRPGKEQIYMIDQKTYDSIQSQRRIGSYATFLVGKDKISNLKKLSEIQNLSDNWNNNGAEHFSDALIKSVRKIILGITYQPEIFPTACNAIQLEWDNEQDEYLEMEILEDGINVFSIDAEGDEKQWSTSVDIDVINRIVGEFYGK